MTTSDSENAVTETNVETTSGEEVVTTTPVETVVTEEPQVEFFPEPESGSRSSEVADLLNIGGKREVAEETQSEEELNQNLKVEAEAIAEAGGLDKDEVLKALQAQVAQLTEKLTAREKIEQDQKLAQEEEQKKATEEKEKNDVQRFLVDKKDGIFQFVDEDADITDIIGTPEGLKQFGSKIAHTAIREAIRYMLPVTQAEVARGQAIYLFSEQFFKANPDLRKFSNTVSEVTNEILAKDPSTKPEKLFDEVSVEVRKRHNIDAGGKTVVVKKPAGLSSAGTGAVSGASQVQGEKQTLKRDLGMLLKRS